MASVVKRFERSVDWKSAIKMQDHLTQKVKADSKALPIRVLHPVEGNVVRSLTRSNTQHVQDLVLFCVPYNYTV